MKITIDIPDEIIPSIDKFITKYFPDDAAPRFHPQTGALLPLLPKWTSEEYFELQIQHIVDRATAEFPTEESAALVAQIETLKTEIAERHKVKKEPNGGPPPPPPESPDQPPPVRFHEQRNN